MLGTDRSSYVTRRRPPTIAQRLARHAERLCVSVMTAAALHSGAEPKNPQMVVRLGSLSGDPGA